eukprot:scaffold11725_cov116-Cylindrotheca_fusiformis.AAC.14
MKVTQDPSNSMSIDHHLQPPKLKCDLSNQGRWRLRSGITCPDGKPIKNKDTTRIVTFSDAVEESEIPSWRDFSWEETTDYWLSEEECAKTEHRMRREIAMLEKGKILRDKKYCSRGLERYLAKNAIPRATNIQEGLFAVLQVQYDLRQRPERDFDYDDIRIAEAYQGVSSSCHMWASVIGLRDMRNAEKYLEDLLEYPPEVSCPRSVFRAEENPQTTKALLRHELVPRTA